MAGIRSLLSTAAVCLQHGERWLALTTLQDALTLAQSMRPTRKMRCMRAYIAQAMEAIR